MPNRGITHIDETLDGIINARTNFFVDFQKAVKTKPFDLKDIEIKKLFTKIEKLNIGVTDKALETIKIHRPALYAEIMKERQAEEDERVYAKTKDVVIDTLKCGFVTPKSINDYCAMGGITRSLQRVVNRLISEGLVKIVRNPGEEERYEVA